MSIDRWILQSPPVVEAYDTARADFDAYVDSEAASTQDGAEITETYLDQIRQIIDISQRYEAIDPSDGRGTRQILDYSSGT